MTRIILVTGRQDGPTETQNISAFVDEVTVTLRKPDGNIKNTTNGLPNLRLGNVDVLIVIYTKKRQTNFVKPLIRYYCGF